MKTQQMNVIRRCIARRIYEYRRAYNNKDYAALRYLLPKLQAYFELSFISILTYSRAVEMLNITLDNTLKIRGCE